MDSTGLISKRIQSKRNQLFLDERSTNRQTKSIVIRERSRLDRIEDGSTAEA
jgi:hypothetical protein